MKSQVTLKKEPILPHKETIFTLYLRPSSFIDTVQRKREQYSKEKEDDLLLHASMEKDHFYIELLGAG